MTKLIVKGKEVRSKFNNSIEVDFRFHKEDGTPIMIRGGVNRDGQEYHAGQISSSIHWAITDAHEHFREEMKELFPDGYSLQFEFTDLIGNPIELNNAK